MDHFEPYTLNTCRDCGHVVVLCDREPEEREQDEACLSIDETGYG